MVAAVATMIANMTTLEMPMPVNTSKRLVDNFFAAPARDRSFSAIGFSPPAVSSRMSSMRCMLCQKNRYGEIVVPSTPTKSAR